MSAKLFLGISAILGLAYGIAFLFAPVPTGEIYGVAMSPPTIMEVRFWGATLIGLGLIFWLVRGTTDAAVLRGLLSGFAVGNLAGLWVAINGTIAGTMNATGWSAVAIYALLLAGCIVTLARLPKRAAA